MIGSHTKVVVTGMGVVSPIGIGVNEFWDALINGKSGIGPISSFETTGYPVKIAGEVRDFDLRHYLGPQIRPHHYSRQTQMGLVACNFALEQAGLSPDLLRNHGTMPLVMGVASSATHLVEEGVAAVQKRGPQRTPLTIQYIPPAATAGAIAEVFGLNISSTTISSCCPSGLDAIYEASQLIRHGRADRVLVGAADSYVTPITVAGFAAIKLTTPNTSFPPEEVCRPFDRQRSGVVFSEGAGFLVLERLDSALARGATPLMEVLGGARYTDDAGIDLMGGLSKSMDGALKNAGLMPNQVDYICTNAQGHPEMDALEAQMIRKVFGADTDHIPASSIRGGMGHALAASAVMQAITCAMIMKHQRIPPTKNLDDPDPQCRLNHVMGRDCRTKVDIAIANSHGMASENSTMVVKRCS